MLSLAGEFGISQPVQEGDQDLLKIRSLLLRIEVFVFFQQIDVSFCHGECFGSYLLYFVFKTFINELKECPMTSWMFSFLLKNRLHLLNDLRDPFLTVSPCTCKH